MDADVSMGDCPPYHQPEPPAPAPGAHHHHQASQALLPSSHFQSLPVEILARVLAHLPDLAALHGAVLTCRRARDAYGQFHTQIVVRGIFARRLAAVWGYHHAGAVHGEVTFAVAHARCGRLDPPGSGSGAGGVGGFVAREDARALLEAAWPVFRRLRADELLVAPAVALARCFWVGDSTPDDAGGSGGGGGGGQQRRAAFSLLRAIWCCEVPFGDAARCDAGGDGDALLDPAAYRARLPRWEPTFIPVGRALADMLLALIEGEGGAVMAGEEDRARGRVAREAVLTGVRVLAASAPGLEPAVHTAEVRDSKIVLRPGRHEGGAAGSSSSSSPPGRTIGFVYNAPRRPVDEPRKVMRPRGTIVWRYDPGEVPYPLIDEARMSPFDRLR